MEWKCLDWSSSFLSLPPRYSYFTVTEGIIGLSYAVRGKLRLRRLPAPLCGWFLGERYYEKFAKRELSSFCSSSAKLKKRERERFDPRSKDNETNDTKIIHDNGNDIDERDSHCIVQTIIYFCWHGREGSRYSWNTAGKQCPHWFKFCVTLLTVNNRPKDGWLRIHYTSSR